MKPSMHQMLFLSVALHGLLVAGIANMPPSANQADASKTDASHALHVRLLGETVPKQQAPVHFEPVDNKQLTPIASNTSPASNGEQIAVYQNESMPEKTEADTTMVALHPLPETTESLADYLQENEVDRVAMPINNLDESKFTHAEYIVQPIKLRLYIDKFGRLKKVETLYAPDLDKPVTHELMLALSELKFVPAIKQKAEVNSIKEASFSF